jgi:TonB family protein
MAIGTQIQGWGGASRRSVQRFRMQSPLDVAVLRSGIPDFVPGRSVNVCERGIAAILAGELVAGETVGVEVRLSPESEPLRTRATVRYQDRLQCGLEFVSLSASQRQAIREWAKEAKGETELVATPVVSLAATKEESKQEENSNSGGGGTGGPRKKRRRWGLVVTFLLIAVAAAGVGWWRWNRAWEQLETGLKIELAPSEKPQAQVPTEVMQKLLVHRVEPAYPAEARKDHLQGVIALDIVVAKDGSVLRMRALNGPDVLAQAAMDALRWWKFEPYRVNGEPAIVETTVAVEFKE